MYLRLSVYVAKQKKKMGEDSRCITQISENGVYVILIVDLFRYADRATGRQMEIGIIGSL